MMPPDALPHGPPATALPAHSGRTSVNERDGLVIADIELSPALGHDVMLRRGRRHDGARDLAAATEHQHSHGNFSTLEKLAPRASLAESWGATPAGRGQGMFNVASSQASVRSCSGL